MSQDYCTWRFSSSPTKTDLPTDPISLQVLILNPNRLAKSELLPSVSELFIRTNQFSVRMQLMLHVNFTLHQLALPIYEIDQIC